ncbi:MAG: undecaprenyldiphospho-muramoylpentapeptide beta-N-acetylglucosaminyltransferase [Ruminococcaceae bacterium]|nr:undecaprenyldiphospho-muramoylpentapeptide beta-N-acetylglucosaminyltransferase [Oscillospiraceae bacterium]
MNIILSGGGTAGHINPAIAIANYVLSKEPDSKILFIGTKKGLENKLIPNEGFDIKYIDVEGFSTESKIKNLRPGIKFATGILKCLSIISAFKPDAVVGTGGYVCAPVVFAANLLNIPTIIHEQNVFPGAAIKFLSKKSTVTAISFDESKDYLKSAKSILTTGNPIRPAILSSSRELSRKSLELNEKKLILALGGSLGAAAINDTIVEFIKKNTDTSLKVILSTGERDYDRVINQLKDTNNETFEIRKYIEDMDTVLSAADLVVCRSGAITLSEICALGKASVLIPSPNVVNNHQEYNARALEKSNAAFVILEKELTYDLFLDKVQSVIYSDSKRSEMEKNALSLAKTQACEIIYDKLKDIVTKK